MPVIRQRLEIERVQGGIPRSTPPELAPKLQSLPPILHKTFPIPISRYSKASRGLSVLVWLDGIFTAIVNSPSPSSRQCSDREAIHARRNLPDKVFRLVCYLITSILYRSGHRFHCASPYRYRVRTISSPLIWSSAYSL